MKRKGTNGAAWRSEARKKRENAKKEWWQRLFPDHYGMAKQG